MSDTWLDILRAVRLIEAALFTVDATAPAVTGPGGAVVASLTSQAVVRTIEVDLADLVRSGASLGWGDLVERLLEMVRAHLLTVAPEQTTWLGGLRDDGVGRALGKLHLRPAHPWTLRELGRQAGLSRSALAVRFEQAIGIPPMRYLARWRIQLAAALLAGTAMRLAEIAERVGYGSETSLSRAFKRLVGVAPASWRARSAHGQAAPWLGATLQVVEDREVSREGSRISGLESAGGATEQA